MTNATGNKIPNMCLAEKGSIQAWFSIFFYLMIGGRLPCHGSRDYSYGSRCAAGRFTITIAQRLLLVAR